MYILKGTSAKKSREIVTISFFIVVVICNMSSLSLALKKRRISFLNFSYVYLTMQIPAMKFDPVPLIWLTHKYSPIYWPNDGDVNGVPLYFD